MNNEFLKGRVVSTQAQIIALEGALLELSSGGIQSYTIDTGQGRQTVTRANLTEINKQLDALYNRLNILSMRLHGGAVHQGGPAW